MLPIIYNYRKTVSFSKNSHNFSPTMQRESKKFVDDVVETVRQSIADMHILARERKVLSKQVSIDNKRRTISRHLEMLSLELTKLEMEIKELTVVSDEIFDDITSYHKSLFRAIKEAHHDQVLADI